jgi:hypothetical protein
MSLLNLSAGEFIALFSTASAILVTLYLLDKSRRRQVVATLRFWRAADTTTELHQKRRIQQPWSLILQLLSIALLLLAIAQLQWGSPERNTRDHVLILDTSAWMGAHTAHGTLMDDARAAALAYVRAVPQPHRILLVRADGLATPATPMESNRAAVERAIRASRPSASALNLDQALEFARRAQSGQGHAPGEIVYVGAARITAADGVTAALPDNLRVIPVNAPVDNCGIRRIGLRRSPTATDEWEVVVSTRNYGTLPQTTQIALQFGGAPIGSRTLTLKPGTEQESTFAFRTKAAGWIEARLLNEDAFPDDNRAVLEVPAQSGLRVMVYTNEPELLRPVLAANPRVSAQFRSPSAFEPSPQADVIILDRFAPGTSPQLPSIWIEPPAQRSPVSVRTIASGARLTQWNSDHELGAGLRTKDVKFDSVEIFRPSQNDVVVASSEQGAVILARPQTPDHPKLAVLGFHPVRSAMKYELATPLLFANLMRWIRPDIFRRWELNGGTVGSVEVNLGKKVDPAAIRVISDNGKAVPYTINAGRLRFFSGAAGNVRIQTGDREIVYSLTLPEVGASEWVIPARVKRGIPRFRIQDSPVTDLWPWLAITGALGLLLEWFLFGRGRRAGKVTRARIRTGHRVLQKRAS